MNTRRCRRYLVIACILLESTACSYIKGLFPDKERDYQFRAEIPEIIVPDDLKPQALTSLNRPVIATRPVLEPVLEKKPEVKTEDVKAKANIKPITQAVPVPKVAEVNAVQVEVSNAAISSIQIDQNKIQAWRLIGRALSRQQIEVIERNTENSYFFVKYDPDAKKPEDKTFWDEIDFLFGQDPSHEQQYRISLLEISTQSTEVTVQNNEGHTISDVPATRLLKLITDGINQESPTEASHQDKPVL